MLSRWRSMSAGDLQSSSEKDLFSPPAAPLFTAKMKKAFPDVLVWGNDIPLPILVVKSTGNTKETQVAPRRFSAGGEVARSWGAERGSKPSRAPRSAPRAPERSIQTRAELQHESNLQNAIRDQLALLQRRTGGAPKHTTCQAGAHSITPPLPLCPLH